MLRCCALLSMRNFETLADMGAQGEVTAESMMSVLNDVKALEDLLFAVSNVFKCEVAYPEEKRDELNALVERVTVKLLMSTAVVMSKSEFADFMKRAKEFRDNED